MRKKLMILAVLLGVLTLGACVDNNESASVTAVREAKAEQLKSVAALNNAQAEAELLIAQSEAAINEAKARLTEAQAAQAEAEAKIKELEAKLAEEAYDAELAARLAQAEADKAQAELELAQAQAAIETAALSLQTQLLQLQKELLEAQNELADLEDELADEQLAELSDLAGQYSTALLAYTTGGQEIAGLEVTLASLKADLADWEVLNAKEIAAKEYEIKVYQSQIESLKKYTNYNEDVESAKLELEAAKNAMNEAEDSYNAAVKNYNAVDVSDLKEEKGVDGLKEAVEENAVYKMYNASNNHCGIEFGDYVPVDNVEWKGFELVSEDGEYTYYNWDNDSLLVEMSYKDVRKLKVVIDNFADVADITAKTKAVTDSKKVYDDAVTATATAKAAADAAPTDADKKAAYETALATELTAKADWESATAILEEWQGYVDEVNEAYAWVSDTELGDELMAAVKAYNEAIVAVHTAKAAAEFEMNIAYAAYLEKQIEYNTLYAVVNGSTSSGYYTIISLYDLYYGNTSVLADNILYWYGYGYNLDDDVLSNSYIRYYVGSSGTDMMGTVEIAEAIEMLEGYIEEAQEEIESLKDVTGVEEQIEYVQAEIDAKKAVQSALKVKIDALKARLNEKMAAYTETEDSAA